jgi:hypothetical protein
MTTKPVDRDSRGELSIATDALANLVFSLILNREAELVALVAAGLPGQEELAVVQCGTGGGP